MLLTIHIHINHLGAVRNVLTDTVGTGLMGKMGNKGGVGIRLNIYDTSICLVNSHLAAHSEEFEKRNQDYDDICSRMAFIKSVPPKNILDHDIVFWLGDLNYRLTYQDTEEVKLRIEERKLDLLLDYDQLLEQRRVKRVFVGYDEGHITFIPTYKYDTNTDVWDSSEKGRTPSWCDRVLWRGDNVRQLQYRSHPQLRLSDHKPVSGLFDVGIKVIDTLKYKKVYEETQKQLDRIENEYLPQVTVDTMEVKFGAVRFIETQRQTLTIENTGQVPVQFEFIKKLGDQSYCKDWLRVTPYVSVIDKGGKCEVELEVYVDQRSAWKVNANACKLEDILVLHLVGGKDIFITVSGDYTASCFGFSLLTLCHMHLPLRDYGTHSLHQLPSPTRASRPSEPQLPPFDIPKEIWFLVDHLYKYGMDTPDLFNQPGLHSEMLMVRDALDVGLSPVATGAGTGATGGGDGDVGGCRLPGSVHSVAESLLVFLESLPDSVVPSKLHHRALEQSSSYQMCRQVVREQLEPEHRNVFLYLMAFLRELLTHSPSNSADIKTLAMLFGPLLLRPPPTDHRHRDSQQQAAIDQKKGTFVYHFLINDDAD